MSAEATQTETAAAPQAPVPSSEPKGGYWWGTGRRKSAVARVRVRPGEGRFLINKREVDDYFTELQHRNLMVVPLKLTGLEGKLDVFVNLKGGGYTGQAEAVLLGLSRALKTYDTALEKVLRKEGFLTVDARKVERKKYGQPGARRRFQFSKR